MLRSLLTLSLLALPAVAAAQVKVDFDRQENFSQYRTFDVTVGPLVRSDGTADESNTLTEGRLRRAITSELTARGLEASGPGADLEVRVSARDIERSEIVSSGFNYAPTYWYRPVRLRSGRIAYVRTFGYGYGYGYWPRGFYDDVRTRRFVEGAVTIDVIDRDSGRLVYRAQVNSEIGGNLDKYVAKSVDRAFKKFPVKERGN